MKLERKEGGRGLSRQAKCDFCVSATGLSMLPWQLFFTFYFLFFSFCSLGEFQLPLNSVDLAGPIEEWRELAAVDDGSNQYLGDLCLSLRYVPSSGKLTVAVLEARKLKKMDITGASDPYVKLKLFDSKVFTFFL